ncbi:hypothetical protein DFJ74DRAFT_667821 [Hyaloraphidium curvatum]|nr:hypothetical protein DFJ74DRAFT_667821 [Hyaloraphidium curvatum]
MTVRFTALVALAVLALAVAPARGDVFVQVASYSSGTNCTGGSSLVCCRGVGTVALIAIPTFPPLPGRSVVVELRPRVPSRDDCYRPGARFVAAWMPPCAPHPLIRPAALAIRPFPGVNCSLSNITEIVGRCISDTMASCLPSGSYAYPTGTSGTFAQGTVSAGTACNASGVIALQSIRDGSCADVSALTGGAVPVWGRASCASSPGSISVFLDRNCSQTFNLTVALDGTCKAPLNGTVGVSLLGGGLDDHPSLRRGGLTPSGWQRARRSAGRGSRLSGWE